MRPYTFVILIFIFKFCSTCEDLKNVVIEVEDNTGERFNHTLDGCIEKEIFGSKTIAKISVKHQNIPKLGKDFVEHLVNLDTLEFTDCQIKSIKPGAFTNLQKIRVVEITHNLITEITGGIFDIFNTIKILRLNNNKISTITNEAFSNMTLKEVDLSHNNLTEWKNIWFTHTTTIEKLDISYNAINTIPAKAFDGMPLLRDINFERNKIFYIEFEAFADIKSLEVLNFKSNRLAFINEAVFTDKININLFNIASNNLNDLPANVLQKLIIKEIIIDHNPWLCACLTNLKKWISDNNVIIKKADNCDVPLLPYCIDSATCDVPRDTRGSTLYNYVIDNLSKADRECLGL